MITHNLTEITEMNQSLEIINNLTTYATYMEQTNHTKGNVILSMFIIGLIGMILGFLYYKKNDKIKEQTKIQKALHTEIFEAYKKLENNEKIKEINISDLPHSLTKDLLDEQGVFSKIFFKGDDKFKHKQPYLFLIRSDMTAEIKQNAKEGEYIIEKKDAQKTKVKFVLTRQKLIDVKIKGKYYRFWVQYEDEAEPYPLLPQHHASQFYNIILALQMTKNLAGAKKGKFPKILIIVGIIGVVGGLGYYAYTKSKQGDLASAQQAVEAINQTINSTTGIQAETITI